MQPPEPVDTREALARPERSERTFLSLCLGLPDAGLSRCEADVVGALSEIVGFVEDPHGLCVLAPWSGDGDDDHEAAGRAA